MSTDDSLNTPFTSKYIKRWSIAMERQQYATALSILDEGLEAAMKGERSNEIVRYTNLKNYTQNILKILSEEKEVSASDLNCFICGKGETDVSILIAGAQGAVCDRCIKICVGAVTSQKQVRGEEYECSFCGKKQSEVSRMIAGPGVFICDECIRLYFQVVAEAEKSEA